MIRMLGWIVLCVGVLAVVGLYFDWFSVSTSRGSAEEHDLHLKFNKNKFNEDINTVKDKVSGKTIEGTIHRIDTARQELTLLGKQTQEVTVTVDKSTKIEIRDKDGSFNELKVNDQVTVLYVEAREGNVARTVTVSNKAETATRP